MSMSTLKLKFKPMSPELEEILEVKPPVRVKHVIVKQYHRKKRLQLSLKLKLGLPQLDQPTEEQQTWFERRISSWTWKRWYE